jgi:hypothetical protein
MIHQGLGVHMEHQRGAFKVKSAFARCDAKIIDAGNLAK